MFPTRILVAEDNAPDVYLLREALKRVGIDYEMHVVSDGESALHFFETVDADEGCACPDLLLLDLNLPKRTGTEILDRMRKGRCANIPVVVLTSSDDPRDREQVKHLGAHHYFRKPSDLEEFFKIGEIVRVILAGPELARTL